MSQIDNSILRYIPTRDVEISKHLYFQFIFVILFLSSIFITSAQAFNDHQRLIIATETVAKSGGNSYDEALVLKHINDIHTLRSSGAITDAVYQRAMVWHAAETLRIAGSQGVIGQTYIVTAQKVSSDKTTVRTGSDIDFLISRRDGEPMTLEELKRVDRAYRRQFNKVLTRRGGPGFTPAREATFFGTDFMVAWDATTEAEHNRMYEYHKSKGSDTYKRYEAARVESQIRLGSTIDYRDAGIYINEMLEQANNKQSKIDKLEKKITGATDDKKKILKNKIKGLTEEKIKYINRITTVNNKIAAQVGARQSSIKLFDSLDLKKYATRQYIETMGNIGVSSRSTPDERQHAKFTIALKIYDLPKAERDVLLRKLPAEFRKQVKGQIKQFHSEPLNRNEILRVQNFLKKSFGGRKLLAKYNWVFKELTKQRSLNINVGKYAHKMNLWLNIIRQVRDAKTDADLAIALGKTFASKTSYGLIAGYIYTGVVERDGIALAKGLTIYFCPPAALPEVVQSIGDSVIDIATTSLFDEQFKELYAVSEFDPISGKIISISPYDETNPVCQFVSEVLDYGYIEKSVEIQEKKGDTSKSEMNKGLTAISKKALIKAISSTYYNGYPLVLQGYAPLVSSCMVVANYTKSINDFTEGLGYTEKIPRNIDANWLDESTYFKTLEPAAKRPLKKLLELRKSARKKVRKALCAGITKNLISRNQAELALNKDNGKKAENMYKRIEAIFKELKIYTFGMKRLEAEGATNIVMGNLITSTKDQNIKKMEVLQRYLGHYGRVLNYRQQAERYYNSLTNESLVVRALTKTPPLAIDPEFDSHLAAEYMKEILISVGEIQEKWLYVKRQALNDQQAELDSDFDKEILRKYYFEIFTHAHFKSVEKGSSHAINPPSGAFHTIWQVLSLELFKNERYQKLSSKAFEKMSDTREKRKQLWTEFREYYKNIKPELAINLPVEIEKGEGVTDYEYYFVAKSNYIQKEGTYTWYINDKIIKKGNGLEYLFEKTGEYRLRLVVSWKKSESVEQEGSIDTNVSFQIKKSEEFEPSEETNTSNTDDKDKDVLNDSDTVAQDEGVETGEGSGEQEVKGESDKDNKTPKSIKKPEKEKVPKDDGTVTVPQDKDVETGEGSVEQETKSDSAKQDLTKLARQKWDWFKKDVPKYLNKLFAKSEGEYGILERRVHQVIAEKKGTQEEADKCLADAKKEAKALRKSIGNAKKEHPKVLRKMHDDQGNSIKVLAHIKAFVNKYKIPKDLKISVSYSSPCLDDNATKELKVSISGSKSYSIKSTETVTLKAIISGGKGPVKIHWEGGNISPSGATAIFAATTPGSYSVQVTAKDASGQSKSDAVSITVKETIMPKLGGLPKEVYYGTSKVIFVEGIQADLPNEQSEDKVDHIDPDDPFSVSTDTDAVRNPFAENARVRISQDSDGSHVGIIIPPADDTEDFGTQPVIEEEEENEYEYVWISSKKGIEFNPPSGKELQVKVTFGNIGNVEIWAEVHKDGELVGETESITTKVIPPKFTLKVKPETLYIGDEGKAIITLEPNIQDKFTDFTWRPMGENAQKLIESGNSRSTTFKLRSIKPATIEVLVRAKSPYYGDEIGSVKYVVSAKPYKVSVSKPKRLDKAPWIWDIKQGKAVELPQAIAVFQNAEVHCIITPKPKEKVRYKWTVSPEGCTVSAPMSKSTNLNAHKTGTYTVTVKVSDKNGIELGTSSISHTVTVSQRDLDVAKQKLEDQQKSKELLQEARKLWKEGKLQQAIAKVDQAQKLMGKDKEITKTLKAMQIQKKQLDHKLIEASDLIKQGKLDAAKKALDSAAMISAKYEKYKEVLKQLADAKKKAEEKKKKKAEDQKKAQELLQKGDKLWKEGKLAEAIVSIQEAQKLLSDNQRVKQLISKMQKEKKQIDKLLQQTETKIKQKKFKEAKGRLKKASKISQKYPPYVKMLTRVKEAEKAEKEKQQIVKKLQELLKKADLLWKSGALNKAVDTMKQAQKLLPKNKKIQKLLNRMRNDKKRLDNLLKDADSKINQKQFQPAETLLKKSAAINSKYPSYREVLKRFESMKKKLEEIQKLLALAKHKWQGKEGEQAIKELDKILIIEARHTEAGKLKREWQNILHEAQKAAAEKEAAEQAANARAEADKKAREAEEQAALAQRIKDIRDAAIIEAAKDKADADKEAEEQATRAKQIQDIRDAAAVKAAEDQAEADRKAKEQAAALAQRIRDAAEKTEEDRGKENNNENLTQRSTYDLEGIWSGWGVVILSKVNSHEYVGTYSDTYGLSISGGEELGFLKIKLIGNKCTGTWGEGDIRSGSIKCEVMPNGKIIKGFYSTVGHQKTGRILTNAGFTWQIKEGSVTKLNSTKSNSFNNKNTSKDTVNVKPIGIRNVSAVPKPTSIEVHPTGGYWKLVETKGSIGRECAPKERYNDYYRDTVSGFGNHVVYTNMIRKGNKVFWKAEGEWKHPPEILYSGSTIEFSATINRLVDTKEYNRRMSIYFDLYDMQCGSTGGGKGIGDIVLNPKSPNTVRKTITWNVKKPSRRHKEEGEKMTIRVCSNSNQAICGENQGMKYYYEWVSEGSTSSDLNAGDIDGIEDIDRNVLKPNSQNTIPAINIKSPPKRNIHKNLKFSLGTWTIKRISGKYDYVGTSAEAKKKIRSQMSYFMTQPVVFGQPNYYQAWKIFNFVEGKNVTVAKNGDFITMSIYSSRYKKDFGSKFEGFFVFKMADNNHFYGSYFHWVWDENRGYYPIVSDLIFGTKGSVIKKPKSRPVGGGANPFGGYRRN